LPPSQEYGTSNISSGLSAVQNNVIVRSGTVEFEDGDDQIISELYDENVKRLDDDIALLVKRLKELKLSDRTLLIITSDHGEELLDHGFVGHASTSLNAKLYDEIIHIPLIFFLPNYLTPKTICKQVQQIDIFPTILDILNINIPDALQGHSMLDLMKCERPVWSELAISETNKGGYQSTEEMKDIILTSLRTPEWKLICTDNKGVMGYELYHLIDDPGEKDNVYKDHPDVLTRLQSLMEQIKSGS
jgi:arylsulfatase A-like enzyme